MKRSATEKTRPLGVGSDATIHPSRIRPDHGLIFANLK
jgi:hypothetical protein